ncbi:MAG TPA: 4-hydroxy-3-methylbut-2-enyl diphosphate reductase [Streptosporangiaceae bacterium]|jgi:4-hydroxy-3-methylbut-2-enyl diphosphate reductase
MNQTAVREFLASGTSVAPGEILVATQLGDLAQGGLPCPAAPLAGALAQRKGRQVRYAPVPHYDDPVNHEGGAALFVATCPQRDGTMAAIAAVTASSDQVAAAAAKSAIADWAAVFGTRRLLAGPGPWCDGARQAMQVAKRTVAGRRTVHIYGQLAGSPESVAALAGQGAVFVGSLAEVPDGGTVVFPAHGVPAEVRAQAQARGLELIDATCPLVAAAQAEARRLAGRGDDVMLIGQPSHPVVAGIAGAAPGKVAMVSTAASTTGLRVADSRRVSYLLQPGIPVEDTAAMTAALRSRFPALRNPNPDSLCYAASDRAETIRALAADCDVLLVLGAPGCADTRQLTALARGRGARAQQVGDIGDIVPSMLAGAEAVGIAESTSARPALAAELSAALSGLGPVSVVRRQVRTEIVGAPGRPG